MEIKWLGTAGFQFTLKEQSFLLDPFFSRNLKAEPVLSLKPEQIEKADAVFLSHGHFDHIMDVPQIASATGCPVFCSGTAAKTLTKRGVAEKQIHPVISDDQDFSFDTFRARAFFSSHVQFDMKLVILTLLKMNFRVYKYQPLLKHYPCGQVLSWRFYIDDKIIHFFGSAGATREELRRFRDEPADILLLPLQGHSDICGIGTAIVSQLKPKCVIVQHHDNFYPPISKRQDIGPFLKDISRKFPDTEVIVPEINTPIII